MNPNVIKNNFENDDNAWDALREEEIKSAEFEKSFDEYMGEDLPDERVQIEARSDEISKFVPIRLEKSGEEQVKAETAHYICPGFLGPDNKCFLELLQNAEGDVYELDRTSDFSMEHALNGILKDAQEKGYRHVDVVTISVASAAMLKAVEEKEKEQHDLYDELDLGVTCIDPFDVNYLAFGDTYKDNLLNRAAQKSLKAIAKMSLVALHPFRDKILKKGALFGAIQEPTSVGFVADQFQNLGTSNLFDENGEMYGKERISGITQAGHKGEKPEGRDELIDTEALAGAIKEAGFEDEIIEKRGTHGMVGDEDLKDESDKKTPVEAYDEIQRKWREG